RRSRGRCRASPCSARRCAAFEPRPSGIMSAVVIWEQSGAVGRLTLNRPETLNAWTDQFGRELLHVVEHEAADDSVRSVLVTGAGRGFSSGADLRAGFEPAEDGGPNIRKELHEVYHPVIA